MVSCCCGGQGDGERQRGIKYNYRSVNTKLKYPLTLKIYPGRKQGCIEQVMNYRSEMYNNPFPLPRHGSSFVFLV